MFFRHLQNRPSRKTTKILQYLHLKLRPRPFLVTSQAGLTAMRGAFPVTITQWCFQGKIFKYIVDSISRDFQQFNNVDKVKKIKRLYLWFFFGNEIKTSKQKLKYHWYKLKAFQSYYHSRYKFTWIFSLGLLHIL